MNRAMDELMVRWAEELHGPDSHSLGGSGGSTLGRLIATKGMMIASTGGGLDLSNMSADIELIVNKHLPPPLERIAWVHYTDYDSPDSIKWERCACSRAQYYRRLDLLHAGIAEILRCRRKRAA